MLFWDQWYMLSWEVQIIDLFGSLGVRMCWTEATTLSGIVSGENKSHTNASVKGSALCCFWSSYWRRGEEQLKIRLYLKKKEEKKKHF